MVVDPQQRSRLLAMKLAALVRDHVGEGDVVAGTFGGGAALLRDGVAWVLADERPERMLGPAMAWARQQGTVDVHVVTDEAAGLLARRAAYFDPQPAVWRVEGRTLVPAVAEPLVAPGALDPAFEPFIATILAGGAEPLVEHGVLVGEVAGLEVCRAVRDPYLDEVRLEVGVGAHDREAFLLVHGSRPPAEALHDVVTKVEVARTGDGPPHPLARLAAERLLRWRLEREPGLVGAADLHPVSPPVPRTNVKDPVPAVAAGTDLEGCPLLVVCSTGVDLDLVPFAADARAADARPGVRLVLAVPPRDDHPVTRALVARLREPAELATVA